MHNVAFEAFKVGAFDLRLENTLKTGQRAISVKFLITHRLEEEQKNGRRRTHAGWP